MRERLSLLTVTRRASQEQDQKVCKAASRYSEGIGGVDFLP
jgi:hypothetical protein